MGSWRKRGLFHKCTGLDITYCIDDRENSIAKCLIETVKAGSPAFVTRKIKKGDELLGIASTANYLNYNFVNPGLPDFRNLVLEHRWPEYYRPNDKVQKSIDKVRLNFSEQEDLVVSGCIEMAKNSFRPPTPTSTY